MKDQALWLYQRLTRSRRRQLLSELRQAGNVPVAILFYHRIADQFPNGWTMSRDDFRRQLDWLQANFDVVSLEEAQQRIRSSHNDRPSVALTFDDGYRDNAEFAIPELAQRHLPATYFVSTDFVASGTAFPHDVEAGKPLEPNTIEELQSFIERGIEIGGHTRSHCDLGKVDSKEQLKNEIVGGSEQLERWLKIKIRYFAFPFGLPQNMSQLAVDVIREAGFKGFCSAYGAWNWPDSEGYHLRRVHADPGLSRLQNWLTFDQRKLQDQAELPFKEPVLAPVAGPVCVEPQEAKVSS